ncbi:mRNA-decapping enzyme 1B-like [Diretmus argenteus]
MSMVIHGIWFYDNKDCQRIAQRMKILTQQEQALAQPQGAWLSPGGGGGGGGAGAGGSGGGSGGGGRDKAVDILQMLTKARSEYDKVGKSSSEPKEIGGSSVLYGNPNLIKPIPVKPNTQDSEGTEPRSLSLATLFGTQHQHHHASKSEPISPMAVSGMGSVVDTSKPGSVARPAVARTLTYDDPVAPGGGLHVGVRAVVGGQTIGDTSGTGGPKIVQGSLIGVTEAGSGIGGTMGVRGPVVGAPEVGHPGSGPSVVAGMPASPTTPHQHQQNQPQHCPAIQKLIQGQRGVGGVLHTVAEPPKNRLCENGVPLEHHHHYLHHLHQQHHHQLQQQYLQQQQQFQANPIQRLFQTQPPPPSSSSSSSSTAPPSYSNPPPLQQPPHLPSLLPAQPLLVDSVVYSGQPLFFSPSKPLPDFPHSNQSALAAQGTGVSSQMPGVVSPHELLQKLQLVQQEQGLVSHDPPRLGPGLATRFLGAAPTQGSNQSTATTGHKGTMQFQVISPQRVPATVPPTLLLSPSVFSQAKSSGGVPAGPQDSCPAPPTMSRPPLQEDLGILSRSQLQATLLHLIQTDGSFLDTIYEAYVSRLAKDPSSKY